ncbi:RNA-guided endonuclease TnpB family protein [Spirulina subsalsa]|uniref:RNA-guided endonuclease TnpB family protein n=1 Tax=Spirulina subsalsa TaxID=54311 RepID=UPI00031A596E|nr:RNA-guided endonuclease TnpB family protein [Spirulina subsalsa]
MLNLNYCYRIYPDASQEQELLDWLEICRGVYNYALAVRVREALRSKGKSLGIDLGLEKFMATSQGELMARPKFFLELQSQLKWLQRRLSKKQKGSKNWHKAREKVAKLHEHIYNTRKNFHYQVAHHLCDQANIIFAEDLNVKAMSRGMLCKHTLDAGFGGFLEVLKHVAWKRDVYFEKVDANFTSQICPNCGVVTGKKDLSQRVHVHFVTLCYATLCVREASRSERERGCP